MTHHGETTIYIDTDQQGEFLDRMVPVIVEYIVTTDRSYGEDPDGSRGTRLIEREVIDAFINSDDLKQITPRLAAWAIKNAKVIFEASR